MFIEHVEMWGLLGMSFIGTSCERNREVHSFIITTSMPGFLGTQSFHQYSHGMMWEKDKQTNTNYMAADIMTEDSS